jgi:hypothetical protein
MIEITREGMGGEGRGGFPPKEKEKEKEKEKKKEKADPSLR